MPYTLLRMASFICLLLLVPAFLAALHASAEMCYLGALSPHLAAQLGLGLTIALLCVLGPAMACNAFVYRQPTRAWAWVTTPLIFGTVTALALFVSSMR